MKKVRVICEAIVPEHLIRDVADILDDYDSLNDAVACEGLNAIIDGSYDYTSRCEIVGVEENDMQELDKAIKILKEQYEKAQKIDWIRNNVAYALYETWKIFDK